MQKFVKVGVFSDVCHAKQAVDDALAAGVSKDAIRMVVPGDTATVETCEPYQEMVAHPASDTERGHIGGMLGAAIGGLLGSLTLFFLGDDQMLGVGLGLVVGIAIGLGCGALIGRMLPEFINKFFETDPKRLLGTIGHGYDTRRSMLAGAIGGAFGAGAGTLASFLLGIPSLWYFISSGLYAAAISVIVGSLVGAMSGRGLASTRMESLADGEHVLVSIDYSKAREMSQQLDDLLRRDGAFMVRTA